MILGRQLEFGMKRVGRGARAKECGKGVKSGALYYRIRKDVGIYCCKGDFLQGERKG